MGKFASNERGAVAVIFAVMAVPFMALGGWSLDHIRLENVKGYLQTQADIGALNAHVENAPEGQWREIMIGEMSRQYPTDWAQNLHVEGAMIDGTKDFRVYAEADVPLAFMKLIPGIGDTQTVAVQAIARLMEPDEVYEPPTFAELNPDAGDYNRIWLYCYWPDRPAGIVDAPRRTQMVPIADNGGSDFAVSPAVPPTGEPDDYDLMVEWTQVRDTYALGLDGREQGIWRREPGSSPREYVYFMPRCPSGSYLSYRLENVRFAREQPQYWDAGAPANHGGDNHTGRFNYYTDTQNPVSGPEAYDGLIHPGTSQPVDMLETILCDNEAQCQPVSDGGIIPDHGSGRIPQKATEPCSPGKYMYYGWEDRPPGVPGSNHDWQHYAWTDQSYDDIRLIIKCPEYYLDGDRNVRLVG